MFLSMGGLSAAGGFDVRSNEPLEEFELGCLADQQVLGDRIVIRHLRDGSTVIRDHAVIDRVESGEVLADRSPVHGVVVPGAGSDDRTGGPLGCAAESPNALGHGIGHLPSGFDMVVEHLVDSDEVGADHVPVNVFEDELEVEQSCESSFELSDDGGRDGGLEAGNRGVRSDAGFGCGGHVGVMPLGDDVKHDSRHGAGHTVLFRRCFGHHGVWNDCPMGKMMVMTSPADDSIAPTSAPLPVRVPMADFYSSLKGVLEAPGPFVSLFLPVFDEEARTSSMAAISDASDLSAAQQAFATSLIESEPSSDDAMIVGLLAGDGTSFVQTFPEGPDRPLIDVAALPRLAPIVEAEQRLRHHVLAVVSSDGVDVLTFPRHGVATLHRAAPGDASYASLLIAEAAKQTETPLVLIAADPDLADEIVERVTVAVPIETRVHAIDAEPDIDALADEAVQLVATDRAAATVQSIRAWKFERSHGLTAGGVQAAIEALRGTDARMVLLTDAVDDQRQAWFGPAPASVAIDLEDASLADELGEELIPARLVDVVLRSAILRNIPVTVVPDLPDETLRDGVGVVRSAVAET